MNTNKSLREQALEWWNGLDKDVKTILFNEYQTWTPANTHEQLTGREIQNIWAVKVGTHNDVEEPPLPETVEEAAKAYLKKIDEEDCMWTESDDEIVLHLAKFASTYQEARNKKLTEALEKIAEWKLPMIDKWWDDAKTSRMSYESAYGSNGVRDYFKSIAKEALKV